MIKYEWKLTVNSSGFPSITGNTKTMVPDKDEIEFLRQAFEGRETLGSTLIMEGTANNEERAAAKTCFPYIGDGLSFSHLEIFTRRRYLNPFNKPNITTLLAIDEADGMTTQGIWGQTDWIKVDNMTDEEVTANALEDPDAQPLSQAELDSLLEWEVTLFDGLEEEDWLKEAEEYHAKYKEDNDDDE